MKLVIDEKLKHRLTGVAVILSLGAIFAPAIMKKSSQNVENSYSVRVKLPAKPTEPNVAVSDAQEVFKTIKMTKVSVPDVSSESQLPDLARAEVLHSDVVVAHEAPAMEQKPAPVNPTLAQVVVIRKPTQTVTHQPVKVAAKKPVVIKKAAVVARAAVNKPKHRTVPVRIARQKPAVQKAMYAVQLASFSRLSNAQALVSKLHRNGYSVSFSKVVGKGGVAYKVYAGHSRQKMDAIKVQKHLASAMRLNGVIVNTANIGVS